MVIIIRRTINRHYFVKGSYVIGDIWMDKKGELWKIDDITETSVILESRFEETNKYLEVFSKSTPKYLDHRIC